MKLQQLREQLARYTSLGKDGGTAERHIPFLQEIERHIDALVDGLAAKEPIETMQDRIALAVLPGIIDRCSRLENEYHPELMVDHAFEIARIFMAHRAESSCKPKN